MPKQPTPPAEMIPTELAPVWVPLADLLPDPNNARRHSEANLGAIRASLRRFGQRKPIVIDQQGIVCAGNGTLEAARAEGLDGLWAVVFPGTAEEARAFAIADNRTGELAEWDNDVLLAQLRDMDAELQAATGFADDDLAALMAALDDMEAGSGAAAGGDTTPLAVRYGVPPFTVLDARQGSWRERKRAWMGLGIRSELGRDENVLGGGLDGAYDLMKQGPGGSAKPRTLAQGLTARRGADGSLTYEPMTNTAGVSVFDPVLCELVYRWFSGPGSHVVDPWAGGSVRGIVATHLGRNYRGIELRGEQVEANEAQRHLAGADGTVDWIHGESTHELGKLDAASADLVFGCPPYYDLEVYSDDPADLSTMSHADFDAAMHRNVAAAARVLRPDRFAVFVVGNVRDKAGHLLDMRRLMVNACEAAGLVFYNDAILVTSVGSLPVRAGRSFAATRVLGRTHQEVLVFVKGDRRAAAGACGEVELEVSLAEDAVSMDATDETPLE